MTPPRTSPARPRPRLRESARRRRLRTLDQPRRAAAGRGAERALSSSAQRRAAGAVVSNSRLSPAGAAVGGAATAPDPASGEGNAPAGDPPLERARYVAQLAAAPIISVDHVGHAASRTPAELGCTPRSAICILERVRDASQLAAAPINSLVHVD